MRRIGPLLLNVIECHGAQMNKHHPTNKRLQPRRKTVERYGTCNRTVERWERDERYRDLGFPQPVRINNRKYDDVDALDEWDKQMAERGRTKATNTND